MSSAREGGPDPPDDSQDSSPGHDADEANSPDQPRQEEAAAERARIARERLALEQALAEADTGEGLRPAEIAAAEQQLSELREQLEQAEKREAELLGALKVNKAKIERVEAALRVAVGERKEGRGLVTVSQPAALASPEPGRTAIEVRGLSKAFQLPAHQSETLKERVLHPFRSRQVERLQALDQINLDIGEGEFLGIAGANGSGKSTLLKLLAGIYAADEGSVRMAGRVAPFIELGVGFNPELPAYDNVVISGVMMGLEPEDARARFDQVVAFAGLEAFTEMKLKNYSSGMRVRLAFSVMAQVDADILLVDEVLAVGDAEFQKKCLERLHDLRSAGTTIVFVTHAMEALVKHCDRAILLDHGRIVLEGSPAEVAERYQGPASSATEDAGRRSSAPPTLPGRPRISAALGGVNLAGAALAGTAALFTAVLVSQLFGPELVRSLVASSGLAVLLVALQGRALVIGILGLAATWLVAILAVEAIPHFVNPHAPVTSAVGGAAYFGTPYRGAQLAVAVVMALVVGAAAAGAVRLGRVVRSEEAAEGARELDAKQTDDRPKGSGRLVAAGAALVAFSLVPDLREHVDQSVLPVVSNWDSANFLLWDYLINQGLVPMKDFFYPYGFQSLFALFPEGPVFIWLTQAAMLGLAAWSLWRLSGGHAVRVILCLVAMALLGLQNPNAMRYLAALLIPITYAALGPARHSRPARAHIVFGAACGLAAFMEADLLLFGAAGAALVLVGELCAGRIGWEPRSLGRRLAVDSVPLLVAGSALTLAWLVSGNAEGNARWFLGLSTTSVFAAPDETTDGGLRLLSAWPSLTSFRVALPALLAAAGLLHALFGDRRGPRVAPILLAGSGVCVLLLFKHIVRPADFVLPVSFLVMAWTAILLWRPRALAVAAAIGAFFGATFATVQTENKGVSSYLREAIASPVNAVRSASLVFDRAAVEEASRERFDIERFTGSSDLAAARAYLSATQGKANVPFAVLGDAQLLYPFFRQDPPYHGDLYAASPIHEQRAMVEALDDEEPQLLVWRRDFFWDRLPYHVRDPLVFDYAIAHYVPQRPGWTVDVLRRRRADEAIATRYWRRRLGATVDLGFIPSLSGAAASAPCSGDDSCAPYAVVEGRGEGSGEAVDLRIRGQSGVFEVLLRTREGVDEYPVRLDRLWFWQLLGPTPQIVSTTPGWSVRQIRLRSGDNLY